ncbi:putative LacI family transcriptional regulator [Gordonia polyisoprenivorans NBRC 16320 = JCM 10675]|uniref:LacI family transcriptional regulator n=1 Tax=Gordonia polyisoprenivorans TaxID=84595 RepID=A0A846WJP1_9ACTN|nr:LacI family DNA-binding transcriptional regulator [Gordonia polyisoprenivorans]NKY01905.1 LacI family transcriptional regulator [Gordonia polyisoprenivorans]OZC34207.1 LacI family transcriptional regulator [Gordonia polyisoprenivorans]GAB24004.1 putative LacI family transcriptional regulator [Gordonia polyisoprenivorans NBRC 16320 = JCM 10675]
MPHRYPVREIARQAGVSEATVDRVLHRRPGVREGTVRQVEQAIADLDRQRAQLRLSGRQFMIDLVMETPRRFSSMVRSALEAELPGLRPAIFRARYHLHETWPVEDLIATLDAIARQGSQAVVLKAPDTPEVAEAIGRLTGVRIPVITLVTDVPMSTRLAYVGMDNRAAGATAAYLMQQWLRHTDVDILVMTSSEMFRGEEEREMGFRAVMRRDDPTRRIIDVSGSDGLDATSRRLAYRALQDNPRIGAVYSIGGGNKGIVAAFADAHRDCEVFLGHDLGPANRDLLRSGGITAVLHHDLRSDMRQVAQTVMSHHGALAGGYRPQVSEIAVITPHNVPGD